MKIKKSLLFKGQKLQDLANSCFGLSTRELFSKSDHCFDIGHAEIHLTFATSPDVIILPSSDGRL